MKICVYGAGAIGGHLAARLARAGEEVSVIARGAHLDAIRADGLTLESTEESFTARVAASDDPRDIGPVDAVIATVKATGLDAMAANVAPLLGPQTPVVFALNGIPWWYMDEFRGAEAEKFPAPIRDAVAHERVIGCTIYSPNTVIRPGVIHQDNPRRNRFVLGELDGPITPRVQALCDSLTRGGAQGEPTTDPRTELWRKLLSNLSSGPVACLTGCNGRQIASDPALRPIVHALADEGVAVAAAWGIKVAHDRDRLRPENFSTHKASILQDLELGRRMEIDAIYGGVQEAGQRKGVQTPMLDTLLALLRARAGLLGLYP
jgi:2-dehydropantoate 2-reductase